MKTQLGDTVTKSRILGALASLRPRGDAKGERASAQIAPPLPPHTISL